MEEKSNVRRIDKDEDFWRLCDYLSTTDFPFTRYRSALLSAFRDRDLYGLQNVEMNYYDPGFMKGSYCMLKCFCVVESSGSRGNACILIWVDPSLRRQGLGTKLVKDLRIKYRDNSSDAFWDAVLPE